jgi:hypothetical protein
MFVTALTGNAVAMMPAATNERSRLGRDVGVFMVFQTLIG